MRIQQIKTKKLEKIENKGGKIGLEEVQGAFPESKQVIKPLKLKLRNSYTNTCYNSFKIKNLKLSQNFVEPERREISKTGFQQ